MRMLISAGPTREFLDPVRFLSHRSTGRMGYAVAAAAIAAGHETALVSGPVALEAPAGLAALDHVVSAREMLATLEARLDWCDALVMSAAVADFRPERAAERKIRKTDMPEALRLVRNPDILLSLRPRKGGRVFAGFAAETGDPDAAAAGKLARKGLDLIVANDVTRPGAGFEVDTNIVTFLAPGAAPERLPLLTKAEVAARLVAKIETLVAAAGRGD